MKHYVRVAVYRVMDRACGDWNRHIFRCWSQPHWLDSLWLWASTQEMDYDE